MMDISVRPSVYLLYIYIGMRAVIFFLWRLWVYVYVGYTWSEPDDKQEAWWPNELQGSRET